MQSCRRMVKRCTRSKVALHESGEFRHRIKEYEDDRTKNRQHALGRLSARCSVVADQNGKDIGLADIATIAAVANQLAQSDLTLEDPTALATKQPGIGSLLMRLGTLIIRNNRDLAQRIFKGFEIA